MFRLLSIIFVICLILLISIIIRNFVVQKINVKSEFTISDSFYKRWLALAQS